MLRSLIVRCLPTPLVHSSLVVLGSIVWVVGLSLFTSSKALAQAAYGSYVGIGGSLGLGEGDDAFGEGDNSGAVIAVRYHFVEVPISLRAQVLISERTAIVPTISYDIPLNWQTDVYLGAGAAIMTGGDVEDTSPIGNQTAFVLQPGIDYSLPNSNVVFFGNAIFAFDAYEEGGDTGISLQGGVGLRF